MNKAWLVVVPMVLAALSAGAGVLDGIKGQDDRVTVDSALYPWSAIGRVNSNLGGFCTGSLIGPKLVLTAAHCLWNKRTRNWMPVQSLHFVAGYARGEWLRHSRVTAIHVGPHYQPGAAYSSDNSEGDWALVDLADPVGDQLGWLGLDGGPEQSNLVQAGYAQDRKHVLTAHAGCGFSPLRLKTLRLHDCDAINGDSGSPIFVWTKDGPVVRAIHVSTVKRAGLIHGGAVPAETFLAPARKLGALALPQVATDRATDPSFR